MYEFETQASGKGMAGQGGDVPPPGDTEVEDLGRRDAPSQSSSPQGAEEEE